MWRSSEVDGSNNVGTPVISFSSASVSSSCKLCMECTDVSRRGLSCVNSLYDGAVR